MISATITGRLTAEPELRSTNDGTPVTTIRLASDNRNGDSTSYLDVTIWGAAGESAAVHLVKGQHITATGILEATTWTDGEGTNRTSWKLEALRSEWHSKPRTAAPAATN